MDYLSRESAPFSEDLWEEIDKAVVDSARRILVGRRFLTIFGPLGAGAQNINIDSEKKAEEANDGIVQTVGRQYAEIPQVYDDFFMLWRDIEASEKSGYPVDITSAMTAAESLSRREDKLIFFGNQALGVSGLLNAPGANKIKRGDWATGENAFADIAKGISALDEKGYIGRYALILSHDLYLDLQRIQPGTGLMEIDRIGRMVDGRIFRAPVLGAGKAVLVCCEPQYMDLVIGIDMTTAYLELVDLNHHMRVLETVLPRIKRQDAIVVFG
ncbi:bacteriocin [Christensenellaceae bacterium]|nr:bacteriocin [Christensenellaceae bacterium]BDF59914.1 bacteriocin [Christensenellaceae bacterium]